MYRMTGLFAGLLLAIIPLAFAQQPEGDPQSPEDALIAQQLVAWTRFQKPQPAPQPLPAHDNPVPEPGQQDQQSKRPAEPQAQDQTPTTQSFTGKIVKNGDKFVLKVASNTTYELQEAGDVSRYVNQSVKVVGNLETGSNTIRVVKIELMS